MQPQVYHNILLLVGDKIQSNVEIFFTYSAFCIYYDAGLAILGTSKKCCVSSLFYVCDNNRKYIFYKYF